MSSTFGGLSTALSGLYAQRRGLEVVGQNIANVNTDGYARQKLVLSSVGAPVQPAVYAIGDPAGGGVQVDAVKRMRDDFLESRAQEEHATSSYLSGMEEIYAKIEQVINEPSDTGIQSQLSAFWSSWEHLSNNPGDSAARSGLLESGTTLAESIGTSYDNISSLWESSRAEFDTFVSEINTTAQNVAELNAAIVRSKQSGVAGNELMDARDLAVLHLGELTGAVFRANENGSVDVTINGSSLVNGAYARQLVSYGARQLVDQSVNPVGVRWSDNQASMSLTSGSIGATSQTLNSVLPTMTGALDDVASMLAQTVNDQHKLGYDLTGTLGLDFFTGNTAATIAVAITTTDQVAASGVAPTPPATSSLDGSNASAIASFAISKTGTDALYQQIVVDLGIASQTVSKRSEIQTAIVEDADAGRLAQSGVSVDEEMTNMIAYQRAYEAAAKVMSTINTTFDSLIGILR